MNTSETKFIRLLKTLTEAELKSFELFLHSPWCNTNKNNIRLLEKIKAYHPDFDTPKMEKEKLFKRILPNGKFSDRRMNNLLSDAYLALEQFIVFEKLTKDKKAQQNMLIEELQDRGLENAFFKESNEAIHHLEAKPIKDWEDHLDLLRLHRRVYHHPVQNPNRPPDGETIVKMGEKLDLVWLLERAAIINEKIFRNRILKDENYEVEAELTKWHITSKGVEHPALDFYRMRFAYTEEDMLNQYFSLRDKFLEEYIDLNEKDKNIHFASLRNDTIKLIRAGYFDITELLPLYKIGLKQGLLIENGVLPFMSFSAIVATSNTKKDFNFTKEVIEIYSEKLDLEIKDEAVVWAKAHTFYYEEKLEECLDILISQHFKNKYFTQISKMLTLQVYFDLYLLNKSYEDYLFSFFDSFEKWVQREKSMSNMVKKSLSRFIQVSRFLAKEYGNINFDREKVENILNNESNIQGSEWLKRKIESIINMKKK